MSTVPAWVAYNASISVVVEAIPVDAPIISAAVLAETDNFEKHKNVSKMLKALERHVLLPANHAANASVACCGVRFRCPLMSPALRVFVQ